MESRRFTERPGDFARVLSRLTEGLALDSDSSTVIGGCIRRLESAYQPFWDAMKAYLEHQGLTDARAFRDGVAV